MSLLYDHHSVSGTDGAILELQDLPHVEMKGGDLRASLHEWELTAVGIRKFPKNAFWRRSSAPRFQKHSGLKEHVSYYERVLLGHPERKYDFLLNIVRRYLGAKRCGKARDELSKGGALALPRVIVIHGLTKASVFEATIVLSLTTKKRHEAHERPNVSQRIAVVARQPTAANRQARAKTAHAAPT